MIRRVQEYTIFENTVLPQQYFRIENTLFVISILRIFHLHNDRNL